ncbi:hypothetical protein BZG36_03421 [Bifiguratus adelaidae]|uniref:Palmitoyltransferase n=1 Tax=Bifiguratus adelaidae TaxID=1938954 RepID=A0A261XYS0_9FUNG|nr:hypothetical protein BZG36_03421 [Bifiguratus adelaidae]
MSTRVPSAKERKRDKCWPIVFTVVAITDIPMKPPAGKTYPKSFIKVLPTLTVLLIVAYVWAVYIVLLCAPLIRANQITRGALYLLFWHLLLVIFLVCYWRVCNTPSGSTQELNTADAVEKADGQAENVRDKPRSNLSISNRWCFECNREKPDRAHHCSVCGVCILRMDHHCPWVMNCVGHHNQKYFVQFVFWSSCLSTFAFGTSVRYWVADGRLPNPAYIVMVVMQVFTAGLFTFAVDLFTIAHIYQTLRNLTTIENAIMGRVDKQHRKEQKAHRPPITCSSTNVEPIQCCSDYGATRHKLDPEVADPPQPVADTATESDVAAPPLGDDSRTAGTNATVATEDQPARMPVFPFTLEGKTIYDLGPAKNWQQIMVPLHPTPGDGITYPVNEARCRTYCEQMAKAEDTTSINDTPH